MIILDAFPLNAAARNEAETALDISDISNSPGWVEKPRGSTSTHTTIRRQM